MKACAGENVDDEERREGVSRRQRLMSTWGGCQDNNFQIDSKNKYDIFKVQVKKFVCK